MGLQLPLSQIKPPSYHSLSLSTDRPAQTLSLAYLDHVLLTLSFPVPPCPADLLRTRLLCRPPGGLQQNSPSSSRPLTTLLLATQLPHHTTALPGVPSAHALGVPELSHDSPR